MRMLIEAVTKIEDVEIAAAATQGKKSISIDSEQWQIWLEAEHSPIRCYLLRITMEDIPYFVSTHFVRHKFGVEHFVRSQREDSLNPVNYERHSARQDALVNHVMFLNAQALINIARKRLCHKAHPETVLVMKAIKRKLEMSQDQYLKALGEVLKPECEYRGECYEFSPCKVKGKT